MVHGDGLNYQSIRTRRDVNGAASAGARTPGSAWTGGCGRLLAMVGRLVIEAVRPVVDCGQWPASAVVGQTVAVRATIFRDGHVLLGAAVQARGPGDPVRAPLVEVEPGLDRWAGEIALPEQGMWEFVIEAWTDVVATWQR